MLSHLCPWAPWARRHAANASPTTPSRGSASRITSRDLPSSLGLPARDLPHDRKRMDKLVSRRRGRANTHSQCPYPCTRRKRAHSPAIEERVRTPSNHDGGPHLIGTTEPHTHDSCEAKRQELPSTLHGSRDTREHSELGRCMIGLR